VTKRDVRYVGAHVPRRVPDGRMLVHNHVRPEGFPNIALGFNGFRAWTEPTDTPNRIVCECGWAPHLPEHYRVDREAVRGAEG